MAKKGLIKADLEADLKKLIEALVEKDDQSSSVEQFYKGLANAVDTYVREAKVEIEAGILVETTGSASAQVGKTTTMGTGYLT